MNISDVNQDGIGIDGMDPVAYYNGEFLRGDPTLSYTIEDITYLFANEENLEAFEEDPGKYIPIGGNLELNGTRVVRGLEETEYSHETTPPPTGRDRGMERENLSDSDS
jgi:YHS domain-containing protein